MKKDLVVVENKDILCCSMDYVQKLLSKGITIQEAERRFTIAHENATKAFYKDETDNFAILNMNVASQRLSALETIKTINSFILEN